MRTSCLLTIAFLLGAAAGCRNESARFLSELDSGNIVARNAAIEGVGKWMVKAATPQLLLLTREDQPPETRILSVKALGNIRDTNAVDVLVPLLQAPDVGLAIASAEALGKLRDARAVSALSRSIADTNLTLVAIWALGHIGDASSVDTLTPLLSSEDQFVRYNARQALKRIGSGE